MGNRETEEIEKAIAEFIRKLEAGKKGKPKPEKGGSPPGENTSPKAGYKA